MVTLYPVGYGTQLITFEVLRDRYAPHMHPEALRRGLAFLVSKGGKIGIGGGYRPPGTQPTQPGFAPPGNSFHEGQQFPSGLYYVAWDLVCANPGGIHRTPQWGEAPKQGTQWAHDCGMHINTNESWHIQPIELDGWTEWVNAGRPDLQYDYPIVGTTSSTSIVVVTPIQEDDEVSNVRFVRNKGFINVFMVGAGPALSVSEEIMKSYPADTPKVFQDNPQSLRALCFQSGLDRNNEVDLVPGGPTDHF